MKINYDDKKFEINLFGKGFLSMLAILFIALKLLDKVDWSWTWVLSPLWIPLAIVLFILLFVLLLTLIGVRR